MRSAIAILSLCMLLLAVTPVLAARTSGVRVDGQHISATITTVPKLLEPGPIEFAIAVSAEGVPLRNTPIQVTLASTQKTFFGATVLTDNDGIAHIAFYLDEGGKPVLTIDAAGEEVSTPILVKGRGILVAGFLISLVVLVVLLLDRP